MAADDGAAQRAGVVVEGPQHDLARSRRAAASAMSRGRRRARCSSRATTGCEKRSRAARRALSSGRACSRAGWRSPTRATGSAEAARRLSAPLMVLMALVGTRADHCLRECRQPDAGARGSTAPRDGRLSRHWRRPHARRPAGARRGAAAGRGRRHCRAAARAMGECGPGGDGVGSLSLSIDTTPDVRVLAFTLVVSVAHGVRVRPRAGAACRPSRSAAGAEIDGRSRPAARRASVCAACSSSPRSPCRWCCS